MSHRRTGVEADATRENEQHGEKKVCTAREAKTMFGDGTDKAGMMEVSQGIVRQRMVEWTDLEDQKTLK